MVPGGRGKQAMGGCPVTPCLCDWLCESVLVTMKNPVCLCFVSVVVSVSDPSICVAMCTGV